MKNQVDFNLSGLFSKEINLTFLVGAGCSVDAPSCLPTGKKMMKRIIEYACAESEIKKLLKLEGLRFEALVEIIQEQLDPELRLIDYFGECDKPNLQHFFLAEMIRQGNFVITTNFDFLIEQALLKTLNKNEKIVTVITEQDFEKFKDPNELFKKNVMTLYKIHGSTKNLITNQNTRSSLITTIQALGANKTENNLFQLENFKKSAFINLTKDHSLVIMGYSGSDDFDIIPTLKVLKNLKNLYWLNFHDDAETQLVIEIVEETIYQSDEFDNLNQMLLEIKRMSNVDHVYRIDLNTSRLIKNSIESNPSVSSTNFISNIRDWLKKNLPEPNNILKFYISFRIYHQLDKLDDALRCIETVLKVAKEDQKMFWISIAVGNIGWINFTRGKYEEALKNYEMAIQFSEELGDLSGKARTLNNSALIFFHWGKYEEALNRYKFAFQINEDLGNDFQKSHNLNNIGMIYEVQGKYKQALDCYEKALKLSKKLGDYHKTATYLNNIAMIHKIKGNYEIALEYYDKALQIADLLSDLSGIATYLNNIAMIYNELGTPERALKFHNEALNLIKKIGNPINEARIMSNIALIRSKYWKNEDSLDLLENSLQIANQIGHFSGKATYLNNIGMVYYYECKYEEALEIFLEARHLTEQLGDPFKKVTILNNIAMIYKTQGYFWDALKHLEEAENILQSTDLDKSPIAKKIREAIDYIGKKMHLE